MRADPASPAFPPRSAACEGGSSPLQIQQDAPRHPEPGARAIELAAVVAADEIGRAARAAPMRIPPNPHTTMAAKVPSVEASAVGHPIPCRFPNSPPGCRRPDRGDVRFRVGPPGKEPAATHQEPSPVGLRTVRTSAAGTATPQPEP